jgi:hypothetical protein
MQSSLSSIKKAIPRSSSSSSGFPVLAGGAHIFRKKYDPRPYSPAAGARLMAALDDIYATAPLKQVIYENTYCLPEDYGKVRRVLRKVVQAAEYQGPQSACQPALQDAKFKTYLVQQMLKSMLAERLKEMNYDPVKASQVGARS